MSHPRSSAERIQALLERYVEQRIVHGVVVTPEELCRQEPELLEPLREHILEYERLGRALAPATRLEAGSALLHYRIVEKLGEGGMGQVYLADDEKLGRRVALKVLPPEMAVEPERLERFRHEARTVAALTHPNVVTLYSVEEVDGIHFLTMELVEGKTLAALIPAQGLEPGEVLEIAEPLVEALVAAHERGIVHRDLKPANVMVSLEGRLKVLDFGLAKLRAPDAAGENAEAAGALERSLTVEGQVFGTLPYMSPEQVQGRPTDARTDLFSLGVVLYELATGRRPFRGDSSADLLSSILRDAPAPMTGVRPDLPAHLERIVQRCLEKDRRRRFPSARAVRAELAELRRQIDSGVASGAAADGVREPERRRIFISSASEDLAPHRAAACEVVAEMGFEPVTADDPGSAGGVEEHGRRVDGADALVAIVGWRRGPVPGPELGGDALRSWAQWEVSRALRRARPVLVLMADESWPEDHWDEDSEARALVRDFRGELERLAVYFSDEPDGDGGAPSVPGFRARLAEQLERFRRGRTASSAPSGAVDGKLRLRTWPAPELPERPYPVLLPYTHPALFAGRERELAELRGLLDGPVPIVGLYAPSGAGKSSLLAAGLVPALRAGGRPVAFDRHPDEPGIAGRLLGDLLTAGDPEILVFADEDAAGPERQTFVERLAAARRLAGAVPLLVLDQFEDLLRRADRRRARAVVGALLAASVQRQPGLDGPLCRWLLAYRQEFHGRVFDWLGDVLREARSEGLAAVESLPHDLAGLERFHGWPLPPLGTPPPGSAQRMREAARVFREAIERPLGLGYPWRFAGDGAARLASAFGEARVARPGAPLTPELQVVLAHLLEQAEEASSGSSDPGDSRAVIEVPEQPGELIGRALEEHLRRALDAAFPIGRSPSREAALARTRALLSLRELADVHGRRKEGLPADALARAIGAEGEEVLDRLATPSTRLVVMEEHAEGWRYALAHDRMAEVLVAVVEAEGRYGKLGVDAELLALRRFVVLKTELYASGEKEQATRVPRDRFQSIERHAGALLWGPDRQRWWSACRRRRRADRRRSWIRRTVAAAILILVSAGTWTWADRRARLQSLWEQVAEGEPEAAFRAFDRLAALRGADFEELRSRLRRRQSPMDVVELGMGGIDEDRRSAAVLRAVEIALPLVEETPDDPVLIADMVWALDYAPGRDPPHAARARELRDRVLAPWRRRRPPPPLPGPGDGDWADLPGGTFVMGSAPGGEVPAAGEAPENEPAQGPEYRVTVSPFRMLVHEVTHREYRRLVPGHQGVDDHPVEVVWYEAYAYAAWLGGRLPTEAEWEHAARAGCAWEYCTRQGEKTSLDKVAWTRWNSGIEESRRPVMQLEPSPAGLFDLLGNAAEWAADWADAYPEAFESDPWGPVQGDRRIERGGANWYPNPEVSVRATVRGARHPGQGSGTRQGFRVVLPLTRGAR